MTHSKLMLGTAQFGMAYGVANSTGNVQLDSVREILKIASLSDITMLDTAIAYGDSEQKLGLAGVGHFNVVTKLPSIPDDCTSVDKWVEMKVRESLEKLKISSLHGILLHRPEQLHGVFGKALYQSLNDLKKQGVVERIGVSIYSPSELDLIFENHKFDIVQSPFNLIDQRLVKSGWLAKLKTLGVQVHTRSVFLQGVLLMSKVTLPRYFHKWAPLLDRWYSWLSVNKVNPICACLAFVAMFPEVDNVIVGIESAMQLNEIIADFSKDMPINFPDIESDDGDLINPSMWSFL